MQDFLQRHTVTTETSIRRLHASTTVSNLHPIDCGGNLFSMNGGNYRVEDHERGDLFREMSKSLRRGHSMWYLTERQRRSPLDCQSGHGPMVIDFDFHYDVTKLTFPADGTTPPSMMTPQVLEKLVTVLSEALRNEVFAHQSASFEYAVFTQPFMHMDMGSKLDVKDGVHLMFFFQTSCAQARRFRELMLTKYLPSLNSWAKDNYLPLRTNLMQQFEWELIFDEGVANGEANWTIWRCRKPGRDPYRLVRLHRMTMDPFEMEDRQVLTVEDIHRLEYSDTPDWNQVEAFIHHFSVRTIPPLLELDAQFLAETQTLWDEYVKNDCRWLKPTSRKRNLEDMVVQTDHGSLHGLRIHPESRLLTLDVNDPVAAERMQALAAEVDYIVGWMHITREEGLNRLRHLWTALLQPADLDPSLIPTQVKRLEHFWNANLWIGEQGASTIETDGSTATAGENIEAEEKVGREAYRWMPYEPSPVYEDVQMQQRHKMVLKALLAQPNQYQLAHIRQMTDLVMALSGEYYNRGHHKHRIRICWALRDEHPAMLAVWIFHVMRRYYTNPYMVEVADVELENDWNRVLSEWLPMWNSDKLVRTMTTARDGVSMLTILSWAMKCNPQARVRAEQLFQKTLMATDLEGAYHMLQQVNSWGEDDQRRNKRQRVDPLGNAATDANVVRFLQRLYGKSVMSYDTEDKSKKKVPRRVLQYKDGYWVNFSNIWSDMVMEKSLLVEQMRKRTLMEIEQMEVKLTEELATQAAQGGAQAEDTHPLRQEILRMRFQVDVLARYITILGNGKQMETVVDLFLQKIEVADAANKFDKQLHLFPFENGVFDVLALHFRETVPEDMLTVHCGHFFLGALLSRSEWDACVRGECKIQDILLEMEHRREDKCLPHLVEGADNFAERLVKTLKYYNAMFPVPEEAHFFMTLFACLLHGDHQMEQFLTMVIGGGENGKSTFFNKFMRRVLGKLFAVIDHDWWMMTMASDRPNPKLVAIRKARMWVTLDTPHNMVLNDMCLKQNVGSTDPREGRELYDNNLHEFIPQALSFLVSNYEPKLETNDHGTHRRMITTEALQRFYKDEPYEGYPLEYQFKGEKIEEQDLECWAQVFLVLLVQTYLETRGKLAPIPESIKKNTGRYLHENDPVGNFVEQYVVVTDDVNDVVTLLELNAKYEEWYRAYYGTMKNEEKRDMTQALRRRITALLKFTTSADVVQGFPRLRLK